MKGRGVAVQDRAFAAREPDRDLRPVLRGAARVGGQHQFAAQLAKLEGEDLAQARRAAALQHHVAADLQGQAVQ